MAWEEIVPSGCYTIMLQDGSRTFMLNEFPEEVFEATNKARRNQGLEPLRYEE